MSVLMISGTDTGVGKTVLTAAITALALAQRRSVAVLKPAQTGVAPDEAGDLAVIRALCGSAGAGEALTTRELARYPEPLAPDVAARRSGLPAVHPAQAAAAIGELSRSHDLVLVEGAGGLLVRFDDNGATLADIAWALQAPVLLVARAGLGTRNVTALSAEALARRGVDSFGVVVGSWPAEAGLAERCNLRDVPIEAQAPLLGVLPAGMGSLDQAEFLTAARRSLSPVFSGEFDPERLLAEYPA